MLFEGQLDSSVTSNSKESAHERFPRQKMLCLKLLHHSTELRMQMLEFVVCGKALWCLAAPSNQQRKGLVGELWTPKGCSNKKCSLKAHQSCTSLAGGEENHLGPQ